MKVTLHTKKCQSLYHGRDRYWMFCIVVFGIMSFTLQEVHLEVVPLYLDARNDQISFHIKLY